jgi:3D (Asp-Asp-Asp) domain-containing protein
MKRTAIKGCCVGFPGTRTIFIVILLAAVVCIPAGIVGAAGQRITLLNAAFGGFGDVIKVPEQSSEWQTVRMRVTAYCPCEKCCGKYSDGQTACLHKICHGDVFVAADGEYSFGTEMIIDGYNNGKPVKVLDRGGAIQGDRIDVFFSSHEEAVNWGVRYIDVEVRECPQTQ